MLAPYFGLLDRMETCRRTGRVTQLTGLLVESEGPAAAVGDLCEIETGSGRGIRTQVIGFRNGRVLSMPLEETAGLQAGDPIIARSEAGRIAAGRGLLGRVIDGFGEPIDGLGPIEAESWEELHEELPGPLERTHIDEPLITGVRAIDSMLTCGKGQRIGIFGGSGVGKSTLLGAMSRHCSAQVNVIALIGERNREVRAFLDHELGPEGLARSVVVVATSDRPAPVRIRACFQAAAVAGYFRKLGQDVLLVMDSVTRLAMAQREIGLAAGEPPSQKGYTPSVFALLPKICERAGKFTAGSVTAFFTVLVEADDFNEPICDAMRGILDGHIILSRELSAAGHYPAIDVLQSVSRLAPKICTPEHRQWAIRIREALASYRRSEDLINLGAYIAGSNPQLDAAIRARPQLTEFLQQDAEMRADWPDTVARMKDVVALL